MFLAAALQVKATFDSKVNIMNTKTRLTPNIQFITDQQGGEPDILEQVKYKSLRVFSDNQDGKSELIKEIEAPTGGWTHELLIHLDQASFAIEWIGEAYLGNQWVGSTEV